MSLYTLQRFLAYKLHILRRHEAALCRDRIYEPLFLGELKMDTGKIADALINEAQQDLQSN